MSNNRTLRSTSGLKETPAELISKSLSLPRSWKHCRGCNIPLNNISSFGCKLPSRAMLLLGATRWNQTWLKTTIICFDQVDAALAPGYPEDPLVEGFRVTLKRSDIATLGNLNWLNDEVYFEIKRNKSSYLTFHVTVCRKLRSSGIILYLFTSTTIIVL